MSSRPILRRNACDLFKHAGKIQAVLEARKPRDLLDGHARPLLQTQETLRVRDTDLREIFQGGNPHFFFEELTEIVGVHVDVGDGLIQIVIGISGSKMQYDFLRFLKKCPFCPCE